MAREMTSVAALAALLMLTGCAASPNRAPEPAAAPQVQQAAQPTPALRRLMAGNGAQHFEVEAAGGTFGCGGEFISLRHKYQIVLRNGTDARGGQHLTLHMRTSDVSAVGTVSGAEYQWQQSYNVEQNFNVPKGAAYEFTVCNNFRLIGPGSIPNQYFHEITHFTMNANGEITATKTEFRVDCQGPGT